MAGINEFIEKLNQDEVLQQKITAAADASEALQIINEEGFDVSEDDIDNLMSAGINAMEEGELSDDDLDAVNGGLTISVIVTPNTASTKALAPIFGSSSKKKKGGMIQPKLTGKTKGGIISTPYSSGLMSGGPDQGGQMFV